VVTAGGVVALGLGVTVVTVVTVVPALGLVSAGVVALEGVTGLSSSVEKLQKNQVLFRIINCNLYNKQI
jgi:hypothetical protein